MVELVIILFLFGLVSGIVASNKGRSGFGWFVIGVLLGPFGFILALVVSKNEDAISKDKLRSGELRKCPYCAELIKNEAIVCRYCGKDIAESSPESETESETSPTEGRNPLVVILVAIMIVVVITIVGRVVKEIW